MRWRRWRQRTRGATWWWRCGGGWTGAMRRGERKVPMRVTSKRAFFDAWEAGVLGNRTRLWRDPAAAYASQAPEIGFRELRAYGTSGAGAWEKVTRALVFET